MQLETAQKCFSTPGDESPERLEVLGTSISIVLTEGGGPQMRVFRSSTWILLGESVGKNSLMFGESGVNSTPDSTPESATEARRGNCGRACRDKSIPVTELLYAELIIKQKVASYRSLKGQFGSKNAVGIVNFPVTVAEVFHLQPTLPR